MAINAVYPPILVKSYFLDVTNAGADKINSINEGLAYAEARHSAAQAEARSTLDEAASYRQQTVESARGRSRQFFPTDRTVPTRGTVRGGRTYVQARQMALTRRYYETMRDVLKTVSTKVLLDSGEPADLTIFTPTGRPPAAAPAGWASAEYRGACARRGALPPASRKRPRRGCASGSKLDSFRAKRATFCVAPAQNCRFLRLCGLIGCARRYRGPGAARQRNCVRVLRHWLFWPACAYRPRCWPTRARKQQQPPTRPPHPTHARRRPSRTTAFSARWPVRASISSRPAARWVS